MAKRKRLKPAAFTRFETKSKRVGADAGADLEAKADYPMGVAPGAVTRAPIAQVASDTATHAALEELVDEVEAARNTGRLVMDIALDKIKVDHLLRDRMGADPEEMDVLKASLLARGQQNPIEVIDLGDDRYGLISGWRRLAAFEALKAEADGSEFDTIHALIKPLEGATESYIAMVEENEIRVGLSFYERARLASEAARIGVYPTPARAVQGLFAHAPSAKRSKITAFLRIHDRLGAALRYPTSISEKLGLAVSKALDGDGGFEMRAKDRLRRSQIGNASDERAALERALKGQDGAPVGAAKIHVAPGIVLEAKPGRVVLSGKAVDDEMAQALQVWLSERNKA